MGRRIGAYVIDSAFVLLMFTAVVSAVSPESGISSASLTNERTYILAGLAGGAIQLVYFVLGWTFWRGTPGQRLLGISVVGGSDGKAMSAMDAIVRWAVLQGPFALVTITPLAISPVVAALALGWSAYLFYSTQSDANHQGLHDHFLKTRVVAS